MRVDCSQEQGKRPHILSSDLSVTTEAVAENECDYMGNSPVNKVWVSSEISLFSGIQTMCGIEIKVDDEEHKWPSM